MAKPASPKSEEIKGAHFTNAKEREKGVFYNSGANASGLWAPAFRLLF
jgi:hypothetical protein